ncbi:MAG: GNAT family N-acetyltransferase [Pararhizobium sp.]
MRAELADVAAVDSGPGTAAIAVARSVEEVEQLRPVWASLPVRDIDSDIDYYLTVVRNSDRSIGPYVIHLQGEQRRDIIVVARLENWVLPIRLGYFALRSITCRTLVLSFDGILGARTREDFELAAAALRRSLDTADADMVFMGHVPAEGKLARAVETVVPWIRRKHGHTVTRRWTTDLPETFEELLGRRSTKTRQNLRHADKQMRKRFDGRLRLRRFDRADEFEELCSDMTAVAERSYQARLGVSFSGSPMQTALLRLGVEKGWHRTWMVYIDDRPVAFWTGLGYAGSFFVGTPGFDPDYARYSIGRFTMLRMLEDLCADPTIERVDYGQGEAEYKAAFGQAEHWEKDIVIASARLRPLALLTALSLITLLENAIKRTAVRLRWHRRIKARLRHGKRGTAGGDDG